MVKRGGFRALSIELDEMPPLHYASSTPYNQQHSIINFAEVTAGTAASVTPTPQRNSRKSITAMDRIMRNQQHSPLTSLRSRGATFKTPYEEETRIDWPNKNSPSTLRLPDPDSVKG